MILAPLMLAVLSAPSPISFAEAEISEAAGKRRADVRFAVLPKLGSESYRIVGDGRRVTIFGGDAVGEMYGAFEFAERLHQKGDSAWKTRVSGSPYLRDRGLNLFLTLPWNYQKNDTDYAIGALTDPKRWWFQNEDYWTTLLDLMAHSRMNWLDIHGSWDISVTNAPNLYAYFVTAPSFPLVGVPSAVKEADLRQLNHVIDMAHARGIRVSLMAYEANLKIPQNPNPPYPASEANIYKYTKEAVEQMIRRVPGLDAIGFRIGESGHGESFFTCYGEAVKASGRDIPLITRSWVTRKQKVLPLARAAKDFTVEIKYNGEQWGAPYMVAGGRMANWGSYSYEDYLSDSNVGDSAVAEAARSSAESRAGHTRAVLGQAAPATAAHMWPGNPVQDRDGHATERWPSEPYKIVWQVRANGTHRIFPFYNPDMVRQTIQTMKIGTASGYTIEGEDAYFPKSPDYYLAHPETDKYCNWIHQRDEVYWMCWGRLGYDPTVPNSTFESHMWKWFGGETPKIASRWSRDSRLLALCYAQYSLGPDHRDHAPELEWGGTIDDFISGSPFDTFRYVGPAESVAELGLHLPDPRSQQGFATPLEPIETGAAPSGNPFAFAGQKEKKSGESPVNTSALPSAGSIRFRSLDRELNMVEHLEDYYDSKFTAAKISAVAQMVDFAPGIPSKPLTDLLTDWRYLSDSAAALAYRPFTDRLRMHTNAFHWRNELQKVEADTNPRLSSAKPINLLNDLEAIQWSPSVKWLVTDRFVRCDAEGVTGADLLVKPLPSSTFFHRIPMKLQSHHGSMFTITVPRPPCGLCVSCAVHANSAESLTTGQFPRGSKEDRESTPYKVIPAQAGPTPQIYAADEAMTFLDPKILTPNKFGAMLIGTRAGQFFGRFDRSTKRKLLEGVEKGLKLVILQEDFGKDKLDFLPSPLKFETGNWTAFDPGGQLGLQKIETADIMWQRFLPSEGWEVFGNGGLARSRYGKGEIWVTSARLMQRMVIPNAAKDFAAMLSLGGKTKPTVIIDSGSEGGPLTTSCHPDMMNALGIPFLTLGEAIAQEQGMNSFTAIPGPVMADDVLGGKGTEMANKFLRDQVIAMSKRPTPASISAFEIERKKRKQELMRSLGLDPMPARTPLNARITGMIQREGYHIEKLVFESRPRFYVTAHVYVPDGAQADTGSVDVKTRIREYAQANTRISEYANTTEDAAADARGSASGVFTYSPIHVFTDAKRFPVIMNVNGHWAHKKDEDRIQLRCAFQALQGYIAIAVDSPGWSFEGDNLIERRAEGDHNDWKMVEGGSNTTGYYVWDTMRALDYMATRSDTDMTRVGITGASGGGLATLYAFAADDRYKAAVPVVYMASLEEAPDNGCLCNHVPGTCQIGDRSDVIAIQAPKPVLLMGAENDGEFPADATRLTQKKMAETWKLFGKDGDTYVKIFPGGHDYNQGMREASIGFFNNYLKHEGDGEPVPQPKLEAIDPNDHQLLAADPPIPNERTMRDLSKEYLDQAPASVSIDKVIALNGGRPAATPLNYKETEQAGIKVVTFESEPGLVTPGILDMPSPHADRIRIVVADDGKAQAMHRDADHSTLYLDILGTGELADIQMRYPFYTGRSVAFTGAWQIVRAAEAMRRYAKHIEIEGHGPLSSLAVMYAALLDPSIEKTAGYDCLSTWQDTFRDDVTPFAVQPRAHLMGSLENLRAHVRNGHWSYRS